MDFVRIKNFEKYQHYHTKSITAWIKLYFAILDDYEFAKLPPERKWYFIGLLLLAGKLNNEIPFDPQFISIRIGGNPIDINNTLMSLNNKLIVIIKDKIRKDKRRGDSQKSNRQGLYKVKTLYRQFAHLKITVEDNKKLLDLGYTQKEIDNIYDRIENYKKNTNYKSLYLTARTWLSDNSSKFPKKKTFEKGKYAGQVDEVIGGEDD